VREQATGISHGSEGGLRWGRALRDGVLLWADEDAFGFD
jgi:hypothetical protein